MAITKCGVLCYIRIMILPWFVTLCVGLREGQCGQCAICVRRSSKISPKLRRRTAYSSSAAKTSSIQRPYGSISDLQLPGAKFLMVAEIYYIRQAPKDPPKLPLCAAMCTPHLVIVVEFDCFQRLHGGSLITRLHAAKSSRNLLRPVGLKRSA